MKISAFAFALALLFSGCATAFSLRVDARGALTPSELSAEIAKRYTALGYHELKEKLNPDFTLGEWYVRDALPSDFIGHGVIEGWLWIWIAPGGSGGSSANTTAEVKKIIASIAPSATVTIRQRQFPDLR